jgi:hypothetical protein
MQFMRHTWHLIHNAQGAGLPCFTQLAADASSHEDALSEVIHDQANIHQATSAGHVCS